MARNVTATASPPAKAAKPAAPATVTLKQLAATLAEKHELPKKQTEAVLLDLVALVTRHLKKGERLRLTGLGILQVRKRAARMGRNPATGEAIKIKASKKIAFRGKRGKTPGRQDYAGWPRQRMRSGRDGTIGWPGTESLLPR